MNVFFLTLFAPNLISLIKHQRIPQPQPPSLQQLHKFQTPPHLTLASNDGMIDTIALSPNVAAMQQNQHQAFIAPHLKLVCIKNIFNYQPAGTYAFNRYVSSMVLWMIVNRNIDNNLFN